MTQEHKMETLGQVVLEVVVDQVVLEGKAVLEVMEATLRLVVLLEVQVLLVIMVEEIKRDADTIAAVNLEKQAVAAVAEEEVPLRQVVK